MRKIIAIIFLVVMAVCTMGATVTINTVGNYSIRTREIQLLAVVSATPTIYTALNDTCSCGSFPATWFANGIYGPTPSYQDPSFEKVTILALTPSASISHRMVLELATRVIPNYKVHKDRQGNAIIFIVKPLCTNSVTPTSTATNSPTPTPTPTATNTPTPTCTCVPSMTPCTRCEYGKCKTLKSS